MWSSFGESKPLSLTWFLSEFSSLIGVDLVSLFWHRVIQRYASCQILNTNAYVCICNEMWMYELIVGVLFCPGYLFHFKWLLDLGVCLCQGSSLGPRTYFVMWFIYFIESLSNFVLNNVSCWFSFHNLIVICAQMSFRIMPFCSC